jgi:hypothetical protein
LDLATTASKSFDPAGAPADPGTPTTVTLNGDNTSNAGVDSIVLTDPADPTATPNPFTYLAFSSFGTVTFPAPADQVQVDVWNGTEWVTGVPGPTAELPAGTDPDTVTGIRFTFTNSAGQPIPAGAAGSVDVVLEQRPTVIDLTSATVVTNDMQSQVTRGADTATGTDSADYTIQSSTVTVNATKSFSPSTVVAGNPSTVSIGASNNSAVPLTELTLTEPTQNGADPFADGFPPGTSFGGFTSAIEWPAGATEVSVHYYYSDGTDEVLTSTAADTIPPPDPAKSVGRFTITFTGEIEPGASVNVPFVLDTDQGITTDSTTITNSQTVDGTSGSGSTGTSTATADLTVYTTRLASKIGKTISPNEIASNPGEFVTVELPAGTNTFPISTVPASTIVVQDPPGDPPPPTDWWNHFNATAITQTAVPANATLSIEYWDGTEWLPLPVVPSADFPSDVATGIQGPANYSAQIDPSVVDDVQGLRFTFTSTDPDGFPPGATVQPNITMSLRNELRDGSGPAAGTSETIENCAESAASSPGGETADVVTPSPCPTVTTDADGLPGADDFIDKSWAAPKVLTARSDAQTTAQINWSTGGRSNLSTMVISDPADPTTTALSDSVFNAFDLVSVPAISAAQDPLLQYDQITGVELYNGTAWVPVTGDPCPFLCIGTFPGITLTAAEQASTEGVRFTYAESPNRAEAIAASGDPAAPAVGSGVARSTGNNRAIVLTFQLRDDVRAPISAPDPVVASRIYNTGTAGEINNTTRATGTSAVDSSTVTDTGSDIIRLLDVPLNVAVTKSWDGGPLGVPELGTDPTLYPSGQVTLTATNTTAANVDELTINDPAPLSTSRPFDAFDLLKIESVSVPTGATDSTLELTNADGVTTGYSIADALALNSSQLASVVAIRVINTGRIDAGAAATIVFDTRLRATLRSDGSPVTAAADSPVENIAEAGVEDEGGLPGGNRTARADASIELADGQLTVTAGKTITPAEQTEPDDTPVTVELSGEPGGTIRARRLTLTDETGTFWNAFDFQGFASPLALAAPIDQVRIDACIDRTFTEPTATCEADGGHWVIGALQTEAEANATPLPDGVTNAEVEGLRFVFTRADESLFQPSPHQVLDVSAQRRTDLRSGGQVPSDLSTNSSAPGETSAGSFTNTVDALAEGTFTGGGAPFTAEDTHTVTERYLHAVSSVNVSKSPAGEQQPGTLIPYTLTVTNSGAIAVTDPVITDEIPTDADGPLLVFDPFADPSGPGPYTYALAGSAPTPPSGPAMPTDPADVNVEVTQAGARIQFTFPPGTVLEVGQTYTITIQLMFRTGLAAATNVTNTVDVSGDRPFDTCTPILDPQSGACSADTTVTVASAGALRGVKSVRSTDTQLGVESTVAGTTCSPDTDGFYTGACVPITKPGGTEVWRLNLINTGTLPIDRMTAVDKLPTPGDTGVLTPLPRGSEFRPTFTGTATLADAPAGATMTEYYTTDPAPCIDDLATTGVACPPGAWTGWSDAVDPTTVTALKFVVDFAPELAPAGSIAIDITTRSPAEAPTVGNNPIAWNTVGVAGRVDVNGTLTVTPETEGNKVGVALATGPVTIEKQVTGGGGAYAPTSFSGQLECTSAGVVLDPIPVTLVPGTPTTVDGLPWGADCTVVEDDAGQTTSSATHVTVGTGNDPVPIITVTNVYDLAGLVVIKHVDSAAVDQAGDPISYGPFPVNVECTFLGSPVYATGYGATHLMTADLVDGGSLALSGLPAGASCSVTETDTKDAVATTIRTANSSTTTGPTVSNTATIDLTPNLANLPTNTVQITNSYSVGALHLVKMITGDGAASFGAGPYTFQITCTLDDASGSRTTWNGQVTVGGTHPLETTVSDIATGSRCTVTETGTGGATTSEVVPDEVVIGTDDTASVTATNTFLTGAIHIDKVREGPGADLYGAGPFTVELTCIQQIDGRPSVVPIPGGRSRTLDEANSYRADYLLLPAGSTCVVRESGTGGATTHDILDVDGNPASPVVVTAGSIVNLTAVNTFDVGSLRVTKVLTGDGALNHRDDSFSVHLSCVTLNNGILTPVTIPNGADRTLSPDNGRTTVYDNLPTGAVCRVTEPFSGGAATTTITPRASVVVGDGDEIDVTVTNTFTPVDPDLAFTGTNIVPLALIAIGLIAIGVFLRRRRPLGG